MKKCPARPYHSVLVRIHEADLESANGQGGKVMVALVTDHVGLGALVQRAHAGDRQAYGELYSRVYPKVYSIALKWLRNKVDAEDLAEDVFVHAVSRLGQLREPRCVTAWLSQMTVRLAINRMTRKRERTVGVFEIFEKVSSQYEHPLDTLIREEERQHLWEGMGRLGPLDRNTLVDHYIDGLSLRQISQNVGAPVGTIKRRLHDARHHLRRELE